MRRSSAPPLGHLAPSPRGASLSVGTCDGAVGVIACARRSVARACGFHRVRPGLHRVCARVHRVRPGAPSCVPGAPSRAPEGPSRVPRGSIVCARGSIACDPGLHRVRRRLHRVYPGLHRVPPRVHRVPPLRPSPLPPRRPSSPRGPWRWCLGVIAWFQRVPRGASSWAGEPGALPRHRPRRALRPPPGFPEEFKKEKNRHDGFVNRGSSPLTVYERQSRRSSNRRIPMSIKRENNTKVLDKCTQRCS